MSALTYHRDGTLPQAGEVWVFGSNLEGRHGAGAARIAMKHFGAVYGIGAGHCGRSYAIPTKGWNLETLTLRAIQTHVADFLLYARFGRPELNFFVTRIGCGLAGYTDDEIAPMFECVPENCSMPEEWRRWIGDDAV